MKYMFFAYGLASSNGINSVAAAFEQSKRQKSHFSYSYWLLLLVPLHLFVQREKGLITTDTTTTTTTTTISNWCACNCSSYTAVSCSRRSAMSADGRSHSLVCPLLTQPALTIGNPHLRGACIPCALCAAPRHYCCKLLKSRPGLSKA